MNKYSVINEILEEGFFKATLYGNGVIEIVWDTDIDEITILHLRKMQEAVSELGEDQKMPLYFTTHEFIGISKDARKYATTPEGTKYTLATAVLVNNLAMKMLFNFFMTVNRPKLPTRGFTNREDGFLWLEKISSELRSLTR